MRPPVRQPGASRNAWCDVTIVAALVVAAVGLWKFRLIDMAALPYRLLSPNGDIYTQIYPMSSRAAEWIGSGQLPLWNPFQFCGHPFLATGQYGMLYPLNAVYLVLPTAVALEASVVLHMALCGVFMYAFARSIDLPRLSAVTAAMVFGWSGFIVNEATWFPPALESAAWLPLALLAVEKAIRTPRWAWSVVLAVAISSAFLGGWPQTWMYSMYAIVAYAIARLVSVLRAPERAHLRRTLGTLLASAVLAAGVMAVQLSPMMELVEAGPRRIGGLSAEQATMLTPPAPEWFVTESFHPLPDRAPMAYVGMAALLLAAVSPFASRRRPQVAAFWTLALVGVCAALGVGSPLSALAQAIPGMSWFRAPQRALYLYAVSAAVLAAIGLQALRACNRPRRSVAMLVVVAIVASALLWVVDMPMQQRLHLAVAALVAGATAVSSTQRRRDVLSLVLIALLARDLSHAARNQYERPYHDVSVFDSERVLLDYVKAHQGLDRTYFFVEYEFPETMAKQGTLRGIYSITDYEPLSLSRYDRFFRLLESPATRRPPALTFTGMLNADPTAPGFAVLNLMSVRYVLVATHRTEVRAQLVQVGWRPVPLPGSGGPYMLYETSDVLPRAYVANAATHASDESAALAAIAAPGFDPRRRVVLEEASARALGDGAEPPPITPARVVRYEPTKVVIEAESRGPGWVVLTDTFFPGWRAAVDGRAAPIVRANYLFRAVAVADGHHTVTLEYVPTSFTLGATVTAATLAVMVVLLAHEWRARRRRVAMLAGAVG